MLFSSGIMYGGWQHIYYVDFLGPGSSVPPVYAVDSTYPENWDAAVYVPACNILQAVIEVRDNPTFC